MKPDESATVESVGGAPSIKQRLEDLGIVPNTEISCIMISPLGDPVAYLFRGTVIALRREDSERIKVKIERAEGI